MRRFLNECGHYRASLCLLAGGTLPDFERAGVKNHVANCAGCRKYYDEIKSLTVTLSNWENPFSHIEPDQNTHARWAKDFQAATEPIHPSRFEFIISFLDWCRDMIWPCRRIWTGLAAVWMVILAVDFSARDATQSPAKPEMLRALLESEGFLAESTSPHESRVATPLKPSLSPPRSERRPGISQS